MKRNSLSIINDRRFRNVERGHDFDTREFHLGALCVIKKGEREPGFDQIFVSPLERKEYGTKELMKRLGLLSNVNDTRSSL